MTKKDTRDVFAMLLDEAEQSNADIFSDDTAKDDDRLSGVTAKDINPSDGKAPTLELKWEMAKATANERNKDVLAASSGSDIDGKSWIEALRPNGSKPAFGVSSDGDVYLTKDSRLMNDSERTALMKHFREKAKAKYGLS